MLDLKVLPEAMGTTRRPCADDGDVEACICPDSDLGCCRPVQNGSIPAFFKSRAVIPCTVLFRQARLSVPVVARSYRAFPGCTG